jgi:hypothetical protein
LTLNPAAAMRPLGKPSVLRAVIGFLPVCSVGKTDRGRAPIQITGRRLGDTTTAHGRQIVTVLGGLAEFERELIRARPPPRAASGRLRPA